MSSLARLHSDSLELTRLINKLMERSAATKQKAA